MDTFPSVPCSAVVSREQFVFPASFAQQRLWLVEELEGASATYNIHSAYCLHGMIDIAAFTQAIQTIVQRHESLRTSFEQRDEGVVQIITTPIDVAVPVIDCTHHPQAERLDMAQQLALQEVQQPFDLSQASLLRVKLLRLDETEHILLVTIHHIIADAWSMGVFWQELSQLYAAFVQAQPDPLPPLPIQYADYSQWQRDLFQGSHLETHQNYWKQKLAGELTALPFPTDHPRPPQQTFVGSRASVSLSGELTAAIKVLSRQERCTLFMTLLAAWQTLLYRYTGQADIVVGTPIASRNPVQTEPLIGFFANTLVLRSDLSGNPSFRDLLQRVRQTTLEAYEHQEIPFEKLVEELAPVRDRSRHPLFQVMLALYNTPTSALALPGLIAESLAIDNETTKFDLTLSLQEKDGSLQGAIIYNTDLFDAATIARLSQHFQILIASAVAQPDQSIATLPLLTPEETQLFQTWNQTQAEFPRDTCIHHLLEAQAEQAPEAIAVIDDQQQLTYAELNARANQLAHYLASRGVRPGSHVGLLVDRSVEMLISLFGILKTGATYVPLDPLYKMERIKLMLADVQAEIVVTQQQFTGMLHSSYICLDTEQAAIAAFPTTNLAVAITADLIAYVIYTSGSTGMPKGVAVTHRSVLNLLVAAQQEPGLTAADTVLAVNPICFDISIIDCFLPCLVGARMVVASREATRDPQQLIQLMTRSAVTCMLATPTTWQMLLEAGWQGQPELNMLAGGEAISATLAQALLARGKTLWNVYGPTEATVWVTVSQIRPQDSITIGRPIANTQIYMLDRQLQSVPIGVPGELFIGGVGLAQGYHHRPELTAAKFIPHPFVPGERLYQSGDLARYLVDGRIEWLGRLDHQVKIRGFRVELEEIINVLTNHPSVAAAIVLLREDNPGEPRLVAYVVFDANQIVAIASLRQYLQQQLPDYMIPAAYVPLERFPMTPNGKVDRKALPQPEQSHLSCPNEFAAPKTDLEQQIAEIWQVVLNLTQVGIHDNFFELGGHSLLATQITARIRQKFQVQLPLRCFFDQPTIAALATEITQRQTTATNQPAPPSLKAFSRETWRRQES
jgi:surfactin family lipopeptide synthetase A